MSSEVALVDEGIYCYHFPLHCATIWGHFYLECIVYTKYDISYYRVFNQIYGVPIQCIVLGDVSIFGGCFDNVASVLLLCSLFCCCVCCYAVVFVVMLLCLLLCI